MKRIEKLQTAKSLSDLAKILGYKPKFLTFILYKIPDIDKYTEFIIPKSGGGDRVKHPFYVPLPDRVSGTGGRMFKA